ncbi:hypothetical protein LTR05_000368 [Lithohypha guttulata]|uniref:Centromere protein X n=1 Tax=Lithohypha guttulata TaxID=1690604 RepID=A0AAN7YJC2_9EURO|nr:hypothetical protein LTR05_000368 [Lithohypha guttulata]
MAPTKRARPSFSPPRPGKSKSAKGSARKSTGKAVSTSKRTNGISKYQGVKGTRQAILGSDDDEDDTMDEDEDEDEEEEEEETPRNRGRGNKPGVKSFIDDAASAEDDEEEDLDEGDETTATPAPAPAPRQQKRQTPTRTLPTSSPEPDMILAEIITDPQSTQSPIPEPLVHKMLEHQFENPGKMRVSGAARDLVTRYIEVFVREAIMRSAFERQELEKESGSGGTGFLEVGDLEKAAVQLCLDF